MTKTEHITILFALIVIATVTVGASGISMSAYDQIKEGMTYEEVVRIIGKPGTEGSRASQWWDYGRTLHLAALDRCESHRAVPEWESSHEESDGVEITPEERSPESADPPAVAQMLPSGVPKWWLSPISVSVPAGTAGYTQCLVGVYLLLPHYSAPLFSANPVGAPSHG
jgi:hypothetical protein